MKNSSPFAVFTSVINILQLSMVVKTKFDRKSTGFNFERTKILYQHNFLHFLKAKDINVCLKGQEPEKINFKFQRNYAKSLCRDLHLISMEMFSRKYLAFSAAY